MKGPKIKVDFRIDEDLKKIFRIKDPVCGYFTGNNLQKIHRKDPVISLGGSGFAAAIRGVRFTFSKELFEKLEKEGVVISVDEYRRRKKLEKERQKALAG